MVLTWTRLWEVLSQWSCTLVAREKLLTNADAQATPTPSRPWEEWAGSQHFWSTPKIVNVLPTRAESNSLRRHASHILQGCVFGFCKQKKQLSERNSRAENRGEAKVAGLIRRGLMKQRSIQGLTPSLFSAQAGNETPVPTNWIRKTQG